MTISTVLPSDGVFASARGITAGDAIRPLERHLEEVRRLHYADLAVGFGRAVLPAGRRGC
jgi:hypothetical protein